MELKFVHQNIIILIGSLEVGGTEKHLASIIPQLVARGWNIQIFTYIKKGVIGSTLEEQKIQVENLLTHRMDSIINKLPKFLKRIFRFTAAIFALSKKLKKLEKEKGNGIILHCFLPEPYLVGMIAARLANFSGPFIMSRRSLNYYQNKHRGSAFLEKHFHSKTSLVIGNSHAIIDELRGEGICQDKLRLIYNGVDLQDFYGSNAEQSRMIMRNSLGISDNALVFIIVANLISYKGHEDLLNALAMMRDSLDVMKKYSEGDWFLISVGRDDGIGEKLKQQAKKLNIAEHILWLGPRNDVSQLLHAADIGILSSHEEGFSNAILEGMAAGLPMVVTNVGGNAEAVLHEENGLVVPAHDPVAFSKALLNLASDPNKREKLGRLAKKRVSELFSLQACVESYDKLYQSLTRY